MPAVSTLFIALDAAERDLLLSWIQDGRLPALKALCERGVHGSGDVLPGFGSGAMWPSFSSCLSPARHGRFFKYHMRPGSYRWYRSGTETLRFDPFWEHIAAAGRRVAVINLPYAPLVPQSSAVQLTDWAVHHPVTPQPRSVPEAMAASVCAEFGEDPIGGSCDHDGRGPGDYEAFCAGLEQRIEQKTRHTLDLMGRESWDLLLTAFDESHCVGHQAWHIHDTRHPLHDKAMRDRIGDPVERVYRALDRAIGRLATAAGPDMRVVVTSVTGMTSNFTGNSLLHEVLRRLGGQIDHREATPRRGLKTRAVELLRLAWRTLPYPWRARLHDKIPLARDNSAVRLTERAGHRFFAMPHNDLSGAVRINLQGREPEGRVPPQEYDACCAELSAALRELRNLDTGEPLVTDVLKLRDLYNGPYLDEMADLLVLWNRSAPNRRVGSERVGRIEQPYCGNRSGDHTSHTFFVAAGPGLARGRYQQPFTVMDFGVTLAQWSGVALPAVQAQPMNLEAAVQGRSEPIPCS